MLYDNLPIDDMTKLTQFELATLSHRLIIPNFSLLRAVFAYKVERCVLQLTGDGETLVIDEANLYQYDSKSNLTPDEILRAHIPVLYRDHGWAVATSIIDESFELKGPPLLTLSKTLTEALSDLAFTILEYTKRTNWDQGRIWNISMTFDFVTGDIYYRKEMHYPDDPSGQFPDECIRENVWVLTGPGPSELYLTKTQQHEVQSC